MKIINKTSYYITSTQVY